MKGRPTSRVQLARDAAFGVKPVLAERIAERLGDATPALRPAARRLSLVACVAVVDLMCPDELAVIAAIYHEVLV